MIKIFTKLFNPVRNNNGFSLLEVIMSITIIACVSWFILEIFIVSANANLKAKNMDFASLKAISVIESVKSTESLFYYYDIAELENASDVISGADDVIYYVFFNKDWDEIIVGDISNPGEEASFLMTVSFKNDAEYVAKSIFRFSTSSDNDTKFTEFLSGLMKINVVVTDLKLTPEKSELVSYSADRIFKSQ